MLIRRTRVSPGLSRFAAPEAVAEIETIELTDILYIESVKDYIRLHTRQKEITAKYKISDIETELSGKGFLRTHRSFIVNLKNITAFNANDIMIGTAEIPIGESYKSSVSKILGSF